MACYSHTLDKAGNRVGVTETLIVPLPGDTFLESGGLVVVEAERLAQSITASPQVWTTGTAWTDYTGSDSVHVSLEDTWAFVACA